MPGERKHNCADALMVRYVYMLKVDNIGMKSRFYGQEKILYVGQTTNISRRVREHLYGINSFFLRQNFKHARKIPVFVKYVYGSEYDAIGEELKIKRLTRQKKEELISSPENALVQYVPLKALILKKFGSDDENVCLRI